MERLLRGYFWVIDLLAIVCCALFAADAVENALSARLGWAPRGWARPAAPPAAAMPLRRAPAPPPATALDDLPPRRTTLPLRLLAIMYAPPPTHRRWSLAIIRDDGAMTVGAFGVGSRIRGGVVDDIQQARVFLDLGRGRREFVDLIDLAGDPPPPQRAGGPRGVTRVGDDRYQVDRAALESWLGDVASLSVATRVVPELRAGVVVGFRISYLRGDGPLPALGLRQGDLLTAVNGLELTGPEQALAAYAKLRSARHITLAVERGGKRATIEYDVR